ncbi:MAG: phosphoribosylglycinamide synthetase C domain-containing protein, partial [Gemmatimonadaceae bacterium]
SELQRAVIDRVIDPTLAALREGGTPFTGLLYAGVMLTRSGPKVVEFNCRFGDPETETLLPLLSSSLLDPIVAVARGESLAGIAPFQWKDAASVTTVLAEAGYPESPRSGDTIAFPESDDDVYVFHAGTRVAEGSRPKPDAASDADPGVVTAGGRVLAITAVGATLAVAAAKSRGYAEQVDFDGKQMRRDIGRRELALLAGLGQSQRGSHGA